MSTTGKRTKNTTDGVNIAPSNETISVGKSSKWETLPKVYDSLSSINTVEATKTSVENNFQSYQNYNNFDEMENNLNTESKKMIKREIPDFVNIINSQLNLK